MQLPTSVHIEVARGLRSQRKTARRVDAGWAADSLLSNTDTSSEVGSEVAPQVTGKNVAMLDPHLAGFRRRTTE